MNIVVNQENLTRELASVLPAVETRSTLPMSGLILIEAKKNKLVLSSTNMDFGIKAVLDADIDIDWKIVTDAQRLNDWVSRIPSTSAVRISHDEGDGKILLKANKSRITLPFIETCNFPPFPKMGDHVLTLNGAAMRDLLADAATTVGDRDDRFSGLVIEGGDSSITAVGLSTVRMSVSEIPVSEVAQVIKKFTFLTTRRSVSEIIRLTKSKDSVIKVYISESNLFFAMNDRLLYSRIDSRKVTDWRRGLADQDKQVSIEFDTQEAIDAASRVKTASFHGHINMVVSGGEMKLSGRSENGMESEEIIEAIGDPWENSVNSEYFIDALQVVNADRCFIKHIPGVKRAIEITAPGSPRIAIAGVDKW